MRLSKSAGGGGEDKLLPGFCFMVGLYKIRKTKLLKASHPAPCRREWEKQADTIQPFKRSGCCARFPAAIVTCRVLCPIGWDSDTDISVRRPLRAVTWEGICGYMDGHFWSCILYILVLCWKPTCGWIEVFRLSRKLITASGLPARVAPSRVYSAYDPAPRIPARWDLSSARHPMSAWLSAGDDNSMSYP
jgi:hypothetical protein